MTGSEFRWCKRLIAACLAMGVCSGALAACDQAWVPTSVRYVPPVIAGGTASLVLAPDACVLFYEPMFQPPAATVAISGAEITLVSGIFHLDGFPELPPPHPLVIGVPEIPEGQYQLRLRLQANSYPIPETVLPLSVGGVPTTPIPLGGFALFGIGVATLMSGVFWLRR
jgi:hypothetical protein